MEWCASGCPQVVRGKILVVRSDETGGGKVVPFPFRLCYADSTNHFGGISMKQAIIYTRGIERGALQEQLAEYYSAEYFYGHNICPAAICMASRLAPAAKNLSFTQIVTATQQG